MNPYTFNTTPTGGIEVLQNGQRISTGDAANAANYGYTAPKNSNDATVGSTSFGRALASSPASNPPVNNPVNTQSTTTLSSDKSSDITAANNTFTTLSGKGVTTDPTTGISTYADGTAYNADDDPKQITADTSDEDTAFQDNINQMRANSDAVTASQIASIQTRYDTLKNTQAQVNNSTLGATRNALITSGAAQHDVYSDDALNLRLTQNAQKITDLDNEENDLINQAKAAQLSNNNQYLEELNTQIQKKRDEKVAAASKLNDQLIQANQTARAAKAKAQTDNAISSLYSSGTTDVSSILAKLKDAGYDTITSADVADTIKNITPPGLDDLVKTATANGAPSSVISSILKSSDMNSAYAAAEGYLTNMTGDFADYPQYKKDAIANGLTPLSATDWLAKTQADASTRKTNEAYGTAFASESGKEAAQNANQGVISTSPVTAPSGIVYNAPASIAPYVAFSSNGVKYVDLSSFAGTPTEKNQAVQDAQSAGYKVITNKNTALDVQNIVDANAKLQDMKEAFDNSNSGNAAQRNLYGAALTWAGKALQTNAAAVGTNVYQDAALDILKAMSGVQGFRGGASIIEQVKETFPQNSDSQNVVDTKIANIQKLISDRETALVGSPSVADQTLISQKANESNITASLTNLKKTDPATYSAASSMFTSIDPSTGQPYSAADILLAFPQLNK